MFCRKRTLVESTAGSCHNARKLPKSLPNFLALNRRSRKKYFLILLFLLFHPPITEHKVHQLLQNHLASKSESSKNIYVGRLFPLEVFTMMSHCCVLHFCMIFARNWQKMAAHFCCTKIGRHVYSIKAPNFPI